MSRKPAEKRAETNEELLGRKLRGMFGPQAKRIYASWLGQKSK